MRRQDWQKRGMRELLQGKNEPSIFGDKQRALKIVSRMISIKRSFEKLSVNGQPNDSSFRQFRNILC